MQVNPGIYDIRGDRLTTRIIESKSLDAADNLWVKNLRDNVEANQAEQVITQYNYIKNKAHLASFLYEKMNCNLRDVAPERGFFVTIHTPPEERLLKCRKKKCASARAHFFDRENSV